MRLSRYRIYKRLGDCLPPTSAIKLLEPSLLKDLGDPY